MSTEIEELAKQWMQERGYRDTGTAAKKTWKAIERLATPAEQVEILKKALPGCT
ncbi:MAG: hypothetical protein WCK10_01680 [Candidatus Staskawiczbacteria bacterium]